MRSASSSQGQQPAIPELQGLPGSTTHVKYGVFACDGCDHPFMALQPEARPKKLQEPLLPAETANDPFLVASSSMSNPLADASSTVDSPTRRQFGDTLTHTPAHKERSALNFPLFEFHVDVIQWVDQRLDIRSKVKGVVIDFTGEVQYPRELIIPILSCLVPLLFTMPLVLLYLTRRFFRKSGCCKGLLVLMGAAVLCVCSYAALIWLLVKHLAVEDVQREISMVELLGCPTIYLLLCLAFLLEIFLLRVEDAAAFQARAQLLAGPQATYTMPSKDRNGGDAAECEHSDIHGLISLLRHMSKSLRQKGSGDSLMTSIFQFSVIEQILRSDTSNLHHAPISKILANMRNAPKGPSDCHNLGKRGQEPLTLAWECFAKYRKSGWRHHMSSFGTIALTSLFVAMAPSLMRWLEGVPAVPRGRGLAVQTLVVCYMFISFFGMCGLQILAEHGKHRFAHLKRSLVVILYITSTPHFRPGLHARFLEILHEIVLARDVEGTKNVPITRIEDADDPDAFVVQNFADRFCKQRDLNNIGDEKVSVTFPTLSVNKFFLLRQTIRTLVATERLRQQMFMCAIFICIAVCAVICVFPLMLEHRNPHDHVVVGLAVFVICCLQLSLQLTQAVVMNDIMQAESLSSLKAWRMEIQEVHWTLQAHYKQFPVSEGRLLLDNYFRGLLEPYKFMVTHIEESEKPMSFCGISITYVTRNQIVGTVASSGLVYLIKLLSAHANDKINT